MEDLINRQDAIDAIEDEWTGCCSEYPASQIIYDTVLRIEQLPSAQRTGKWINGNHICPICGEDKFKDLDADIWADWQPKCCPNCGARMKGDSNA